MMDLSAGRSRADRNNGRGEVVPGEPLVPTCCFHRCARINVSVGGAASRMCCWCLDGVWQGATGRKDKQAFWQRARSVLSVKLHRLPTLVRPADLDAKRIPTLIGPLGLPDREPADGGEPLV
jgi:hypothetical protein